MPELVLTDSKTWKVDATRWPVLVISRLSAEISDEAMLASMAASDRIIDERNSVFSVVLDNRLAGGMNAKQRKMIAEHAAKRAEFSKRMCKGTAFVFESPVMRGILTAIFWLRPADVPTRVFADLGEAVQWAGALHTGERRVSIRPGR